MSNLTDRTLELTEATSESIKGFEDHKMRAVVFDLGKRYVETNEKKAFRCADCGSFLAFQSYQHQETQEFRRELVSANFCKVRWCPMCVWLKCRKLLNELVSVFHQIEQNQKVRYISLTLTIRNPSLENLRATTQHMSKAFKRLIKTKQWQESILGYLRGLEFVGDKTQAGQAHPHYHCLLVVSPSYFEPTNYITQVQYYKLWGKALRVDYDPGAHVKIVKPKTKGKDALMSALLECVKYIAKLSDVAKLSQSDFETLDAQSKHIRQYNKGGLVKQYKPIKDQHLLDEIQWQKLEREYFKWCGVNYFQVR